MLAQVHQTFRHLAVQLEHYTISARQLRNCSERHQRTSFLPHFHWRRCAEKCQTSKKLSWHQSYCLPSTIAHHAGTSLGRQPKDAKRSSLTSGHLRIIILHGNLSESGQKQITSQNPRHSSLEIPTVNLLFWFGRVNNDKDGTLCQDWLNSTAERQWWFTCTFWFRKGPHSASSPQNLMCLSMLCLTHESWRHEWAKTLKGKPLAVTLKHTSWQFR